MSRVTVGMSGGVDSSAAALLLKEAGHDVSAVTFTALHETGFKKCCSLEEIGAAKAVCAHLGIPHQVIDVQDVFRAKIIPDFIQGYRNGLTPNPCVWCNRLVKFGAVLEYALAEGAEFVATGHYAAIASDGGELLISVARDALKDQSYFISYVEKEKLPHMIFPLGGITKPEARELVRKSGLPLAHDKGESQDICFIEDDYRDFLLQEGVKETPGDFIYNGSKAGTHRGLAFYSYGQRRGLGVAVGERAFVRGYDAANNRVLLGSKPYAKEFSVARINSFTPRFVTGRYEVKVRYQSPFLPAEAVVEKDRARVVLDELHELITPGQFAVFYREGLVYASGVIDAVSAL